MVNVTPYLHTSTSTAPACAPKKAMIHLPRLKHTDKNAFFLIAGPCAIEGEDIAMEIAERAAARVTRRTVALGEAFDRYWGRNTLSAFEPIQATTAPRGPPPCLAPDRPPLPRTRPHPAPRHPPSTP